MVLETPDLPEPVVAEVKAVLERHHLPLTSIQRPRRSLESLFLEIVEQARAEGVRTAGAQSGGTVAEFLAADQDPSARPPADGQPDTSLIDSLVRR